MAGGQVGFRRLGWLGCCLLLSMGWLCLPREASENDPEESSGLASLVAVFTFATGDLTEALPIAAMAVVFGLFAGKWKIFRAHAFRRTRAEPQEEASRR